MKALELADYCESLAREIDHSHLTHDLIAAATELRRLAAVEAELEDAKQAAKTWENEAERRSDRYTKCAAELERIKALEPVAWGLLHSKGLEFGSVYAPQKTKEAAEEMARQHMGDVTVTALYALGIET